MRNPAASGESIRAEHSSIQLNNTLVGRYHRYVFDKRREQKVITFYVEKYVIPALDIYYHIHFRIKNI